MSVCVSHSPSSNLAAELLPALQLEFQKVQSQELLDRAPQSVDMEVEQGARQFIYSVLETNLPETYREMAPQIAHTLIVEANRYNLDPIFLLAVIKTESRFNPRARGRHGDAGLMQILPNTGNWIAKRLKIATPVDLNNPIINIQIGAAHFANLRKHFDGVGSRYLAAYNMGTRNVHRLLQQEVEPTTYANRVIGNYRQLYTEFAASLPSHKRTLVSLNN